MIRFACPACDKRFRVSDAQAGKQGRCPHCRERIQVPQLAVELDSPIPSSGLRLREEPLDPPIPPKPVTPEVLSQNPPANDTAPGQRKYPVLLDVLLYPSSIPGLINILIFWLLPSGLTLLPIFGFLSLGLGFIIGLYFFAYIASCIRESAEGGTRAPDSIADVPDLSDAFSQWGSIFGTILSFYLPPFFLFMWRGADAVFWAVTGTSLFFFPMALLATVMFDRAAVLFPWVWIPAIFSTLLAYLGLLIVLYLPAVSWYFIPGSNVWNFLFMPIQIYCLMIGAHLLGRFYFRHEERLNWAA